MDDDEGSFTSALAFVLLVTCGAVMLGLLTSAVNPFDPRFSWLTYGSFAGIVGSILVLIRASRQTMSPLDDEYESLMRQTRAERQGNMPGGPQEGSKPATAPTLEEKPLEKPMETPNSEQKESLEQDEGLEQKQLLERGEALEPAKEDLQQLKEALELKEGSLHYKRRGQGIYHVVYDPATKKHRWTYLGSWPQLKPKLQE